MSGPHLRRRMDDAVGAARDLVQQSRVVEGHVSPPSIASESERVRTSVSAARESLRALASYSHAINPAFSVPVLLGPPAEQLAAEARFREASRGQARPGRFFASAQEARAHSREEDAEARRLVLLKYPEARPVDGTAARPPQAAEIERMAIEVRGWFGDSVLGTALATRFSSFPPVVTGEAQQFMRNQGVVSGLLGQSAGMQFPGTNHIALDAEGLFEADRYAGDAERRCVIAHEMFHYAAMLGGGFNMRWRGPNGEPVVQGDVRWLHEGLTEFFAQTLVRERGVVPGGVSYAADTTVSAYLAQMAGTDVLRRAYLTGDMGEVRRLVDRRLGAGAFETIIRSDSGASAFVYIRGRMESRGQAAALSRWDAQPIVRRAGTVGEYRDAEEARRASERDPNAIHSTR